MWTIISTWAMSEDGVKEGAKFLDAVSDSGMCVEKVIINVENNPEFESVGFGGWPNEKGEVQMDSAFMDGNNLNFGAVTALRGIANPIKVSRSLSNEKLNIFLTGQGAIDYARENHFEEKDMLSEKTHVKFIQRSKEIAEGRKKYAGHDTVGTVCIDSDGSISAGSSTSGLIMKKRGRVGDSALPGSGIYADSEIGGAACTGVGEDIMKGCLSYEAVRLMKEGKTPQEACEESLKGLWDRLIKSGQREIAMSIVALDKTGAYGAATVDQEFSFVVATSDSPEPKIYVCKSILDGGEHILAGENWKSEYEDSSNTFKDISDN